MQLNSAGTKKDLQESMLCTVTFKTFSVFGLDSCFGLIIFLHILLLNVYDARSVGAPTEMNYY